VSRILIVSILAIATVAGLGIPAAFAEAPRNDEGAALGSFLAVMDRLKDFNTHVCQQEPQPQFDLFEIGRRALGRHALDYRDPEVTEFGRLVARRLLRWYSGTLHRERTPKSWPDPIFGTGTAVGLWATVSALTPGSHRFVYYLHWHEGAWRVYDIEVDGRSRVRAYYAEFDQIILNEGYDVLLRRLTIDVRRDDDARKHFEMQQKGLDSAARQACEGAVSEACKEARKLAADHANGCRNAS
jgi:ABC-type transporter MlaC component